MAISEREISLTWTTDIRTNGTAKLVKSDGGGESSLPSLVKTWEEFKAYATGLDRARFLFAVKKATNGNCGLHFTDRAAQILPSSCGKMFRHFIGI